MDMSLLRHAFYKLGNNTEESLRNCKWYDNNKQARARALKLLELIANCEDNKNIEYVRSLNL
jgi:hypothetical protein